MITLLAVTALFAIALAISLRASRRRRAEREEALLADLSRRLAEADLVITPEHVAVSSVGYRLPRKRLFSVARRAEDDEAVLTAVQEVLQRPLRPLAGGLSLKIHGPRVRLHFVRPRVLELIEPQPRLARRPEPQLGLTATYRIDGKPDLCVSEEHLREQTIDAEDLHGIALALMRQRFDDELLDRVLGGAREAVESHDGSAASVLLVLADFLPAGATVAATLEGPDHVVLELQNGRETGEPTLLIDDRGWRVS